MLRAYVGWVLAPWHVGPPLPAPTKPDVQRCHTLPTPRREAIPFDAVASTRTLGATTSATSAAMATPPSALEALFVNA